MLCNTEILQNVMLFGITEMNHYLNMLKSKSIFLKLIIASLNLHGGL